MTPGETLMIERNIDLKSAGSALKEVVGVGPAPALHPRSGMRFDPTTGTFVPSRALQIKLQKALMREARSLRNALYILQARLYFEALWLKTLRTALQVRDYVARHF